MNKSILNNFRTKKIGNKILAVTDQGSYHIFAKEEYNKFLKGDYTKELENKGFIINEENFDNIVEKQKSRFSHLYAGVSLHIIALTKRCNLGCAYCHAQAISDNLKTTDMDKETARKIVDFIFQSPTKQIKIEFQGGEPSLNFDTIQEIVEYSEKLNKEKNKNLIFALVTNLTKIDDEKLRYLNEHKIGLCTSLDGPDYVHNKVRKYLNNEGTYEDVVSWIKTIKKVYDRQLDALMVTTRYSLPYPKEIVDEYINLGFKRIQIKFMSNLGYAQKSWSNLGYTPKEFLNFWKKAIDYMVELNIQGKEIYESITTYILKKILTDEPNIFVDLQSPCGAALNQLAYDNEGNVFTCDEGRQYDLFNLGNVKDNSYKEILTSNSAASIIAASTNDCALCDACVYKPYCGLCPVLTYAETGTLTPKLATNDRCKILKGMFDYIFDKIITSESHLKVFENWSKISNTS